MERSRLTLLAVALATFMTYLDNNIINVAIPAIERDLHLTTSGLEWVVSSYILVFASLLLAGGRLADVWGRKRLFLIGLSIFTAASLVAGFAGNVDVLVISRAVQGLGAALVTPTTLAIISATFTEGAATGGRGRHLERGRRARPGGRPAARRAAQPVPELGLDLLHQRPGRPGDAGAGGRGDPRIPGRTPGRAGSTFPG